MSNRNRLYGLNIREARLALNAKGSPRQGDDEPMNQVEFAARCGVTQQTVSAWEKGVAVPRDDMKAVIGEVTGRDPHDLFPLVIPAEAAS